MGNLNRDDSDDSQSMEEACIDDENLFNPLILMRQECSFVALSVLRGCLPLRNLV